VTIGAPLSGMSLLLPLGLVMTVWLARNVAISKRGAPNGSQTWFASCAAGYVGFLLVGLVGTELLSSLHALHRGAVTAWWVAYTVAVSAAILWYRPSRRRSRRAGGRPAPSSIVAGSVAGAVAAYTFWLGATTAPNNSDALLYHLTSAATWATNGNVSPFATYFQAKLFYGRLDEYFLTNILVLDGNDHFAFMAEWLAFVVSALMVTGLARLLGGRRSAGLLGLLLAVTLPLGIMQSTDTQNDLFVASVVLACYYLAALLWRLRRPDPVLLVLIGITAGLGILTKTDAALALIPLAAAMVLMAWRDRWEVPFALRWGAVAIVAAFVLTLPLVARNLQTYHSLLGSGQTLEVTTANPQALALNGVRNLALNADTLRPAWNASILSALAEVGRPLGIDRPSPATNFVSWPAPGGTPSEDGSGSLVAVVAIVMALFALLSRNVRRRLRMHELRPVIGAAITGLALSLVVLRWQPWGGRLQLEALLPSLAAAAAILTAVSKRLLFGISGVLIATSVLLLPSALFQNVSKPLVGSSGYLSLTRNEQMFRWCEEAREPYTEAVDLATSVGQHQVGYVSSGEGSIYPIWALLSQAAHGAPVDVPAVGIRNSSGLGRRLASGDPHVTLVIGKSARDESALADRLGPLGYHARSVSNVGCEVVGIFVRS